MSYDPNPFTGAGIAAEGTQVFNAIMGGGNVWQDLDISSVVGSRYAFVIMNVISNGIPSVYNVRQKGSTRDLATSNNGMGVIDVSNTISGLVGIVTDSSGVIQHKANSPARTYTVNILGWVGLS